MRQFDRDSIWGTRFKFVNTPYTLREHYPKEIAESRRILYPYCKEEKQSIDVKSCKLVKDKLIMAGEDFTRDNEGDNTFFFVKRANMSNFYLAPFECQGVTYKTVEHFYQSEKAILCGEEQSA